MWELDLNLIWFILLWVLLAGYAILDGFDLGVGVLHLFSKSEDERQINMNAIGPVWDGNEVWLVTAGGVLFAAFPVVYATVFSGFYLAMMLLLFALIFRAVSLEFRNQLESRAWRRTWDFGFSLGSLLAAVLFGVAVGNIIRGLPIQQDGTLRISLLYLLNPYSLLIGVLSLMMCVMHGAAYMTVKTEGEQQRRMAYCTIVTWAAFVILYGLATIATFRVAPSILANLEAYPYLWFLVPVAALIVSLLAIPWSMRTGCYLCGFVSSAVTIGCVVGLTGIGLYPRLVPSTVDLQYSLTVENAMSTDYTLGVMLIITCIALPIVLAYTAGIYWIFRGKATVEGKGY